MGSGAMTVITNLNALNTQLSLSRSNQMLSKSLEKLSSGYRINTAADDPSGLIISEQLRTQVAGLHRASQNSQEACNVLGIAEGALIEVNSILTKMRSLAIHAANNGVTAPDQVAADQAEVDSGIQTIERIASTTRFSDQFLLNGSKGIVFDTATTIDSSMNHSLINVDNTRIDQIFKRVGTALTISFSGVNDGTTMTQAQWDMQARQAYVEADKSQNPLTQIDDGKIIANQTFVITGTQGSRQFSFAKGTELGTLYKSINNVKDSIGVGATLIFNSDVNGVNITTDGSYGWETTRSGGENAMVGIYNLNGDFEPKKLAGGIDGYDYKSGVYDVRFSTDGVNNPQENALVPGVNLDGEGRMYIKWISDVNYIAYKDSELAMEIGRGTSGEPIGATNNSGVEKSQLIITASGDTNGWSGNGETPPGKFDDITEYKAPLPDDITVLQFAQHIELNEDYNLGKNAIDMSQMQSIVDSLGLVAGIKDSTGAIVPASATTDGVASSLSGINLGVNTDENGKLYYKFEIDDDPNGTPPDDRVLKIEIFRNSLMNDEDLVACGQAPFNANAPIDAQLDVPIFAMPMADNNHKPSGIYGNLSFTINTGAASPAGGLKDGKIGMQYTGTSRFDEIGLRLYTQDYGSQEYLRYQNIEGQLFGTYKNPESSSMELVKAGTTTQLYGSDATIYINGQAIKTQGLTAMVTTPNYSGKLVFNQGSPGLTTIAQVGQDVGGLYTRGGSLQAVKATDNNSIYEPGDPAYLTWVTNARHTTTETIGHFVGGMQYQLGEGAGDQERTIYAIPSMTMTNLGKTEFNGMRFCLQDVLSGGAASLMNDPIKAMGIITQAVGDVTELRARLGAFQTNMLQTNINSLDVTVENIQKTESAIRDADMAAESTEYTKNQILVQAGTSMLAQANQINQNILSLLGG